MAVENGSLVFVGNLPSGMRESEIDRPFRRIGEIKETYLRNGHMFVQYFESEIAKRAVRMLDGNTIGGRKSKVEISVLGLKRNGRPGDRKRWPSGKKKKPRRRHKQYPTPLMESVIERPIRSSDPNYPPQLMSLDSLSYNGRYAPRFHDDNDTNLPPIIGRCYSPRSGRELPPIRLMPSHDQPITKDFSRRDKRLNRHTGRNFSSANGSSRSSNLRLRSTVRRRDRHGNVIEELPNSGRRQTTPRRQVNRKSPLRRLAARRHSPPRGVESRYIPERRHSPISRNRHLTPEDRSRFRSDKRLTRRYHSSPRSLSPTLEQTSHNDSSYEDSIASDSESDSESYTGSSECSTDIENTNKRRRESDDSEGNARGHSHTAESLHRTSMPTSSHQLNKDGRHERSTSAPRRMPSPPRAVQGRRRHARHSPVRGPRTPSLSPRRTGPQTPPTPRSERSYSPSPIRNSCKSSSSNKHQRNVSSRSLSPRSRVNPIKVGRLSVSPVRGRPHTSSHLKGKHHTSGRPYTPSPKRGGPCTPSSQRGRSYTTSPKRGTSYTPSPQRQLHTSSPKKRRPYTPSPIRGRANTPPPKRKRPFTPSPVRRLTSHTSTRHRNVSPVGGGRRTPSLAGNNRLDKSSTRTHRSHDQEHKRINENHQEK